jgi:hypothetical protein
MLFVASWANSSWLENLHLGTHHCRSPEHFPSRRDEMCILSFGIFYNYKEGRHTARQREKGITFSNYLLLLAESRLARAKMVGMPNLATKASLACI